MPTFKRNLSTHIFEHLYFVWGRGNTKMKKCYLSVEHQVLFPGYATSSCWPWKKKPLNCSSLKRSMDPWDSTSTHSACICEVRADLSRAQNPRKGAMIDMALQQLALPRLMGNHRNSWHPPHPPSSNAGNLVHYLQQTQWDHFLNETPCSPRYARGFPFKPSLHHPIPPISFPSLNLV